LISDADLAYLRSIMTASVTEAGKFASYIAPPRVGIKGRPVDFEYVRL
jgi:benzoyl-CoA 2,3-dioxygenase component B